MPVIDPKKIAEWEKALADKPPETSAEWAMGLYEEEVDAVTKGAAQPWGSGSGDAANAKADVCDALARVRDLIEARVDLGIAHWDHLQSFTEQVARELLSERGEMIHLLREIEYGALPNKANGDAMCPVCLAHLPAGLKGGKTGHLHAQDCRLAAFLTTL